MTDPFGMCPYKNQGWSYSWYEEKASFSLEDMGLEEMAFLTIPGGTLYEIVDEETFIDYRFAWSMDVKEEELFFYEEK